MSYRIHVAGRFAEELTTHSYSKDEMDKLISGIHQNINHNHTHTGAAGIQGVMGPTGIQGVMGPTGVQGSQSRFIDNIRITKGHKNGWSCASSVWETCAFFIFVGTDKVTPSSVRVVASTTHSNVVGSIRIIDMTNTNVVCSHDNVTGVGAYVYDLGTFSNLSTNLAVWEIQIKKTAGSGSKKKVHIYCCSVYY